MSVDIEITVEDFMVASTKASLRQIWNIRKGRIGHDHGSFSKRRIGQRLQDSILGAIAAIVTARFTNLPETDFFDNTKSPDLAGKLEVRSTDYPNGHLLLHEISKDDAYYILVIIEELNAKIYGWIKAKDGKRKEYWREGDPGYYAVPQSALNPINSPEDILKLL